MTAFNAFLSNAKKGDRFEYHVGLLPEDGENREFDAGGNRTKPAKTAVGIAADSAWSAHLAGEVLLLQRRLTRSAQADGAGSFSYIAQRR